MSNGMVTSIEDISIHGEHLNFKRTNQRILMQHSDHRCISRARNFSKLAIQSSTSSSIRVCTRSRREPIPSRVSIGSWPQSPVQAPEHRDIH